MDKEYRIGDSDYVLGFYNNDILFYWTVRSRSSKLEVISLEHARSILIPYIEEKLRNSRGLDVGNTDRHDYEFNMAKGCLSILTSKSYVEYHDEDDHVLSEEWITLLVSEFNEWFDDPKVQRLF